MKIAFSLKNQLNCEKICNDIGKIINKYLSEGNPPEDGVIAIEIIRIKDEEIIKNIETKV
jgi:hypothetical protein